MKRFCLLICLMCSLCCMAQQHMKFMGIPIDGTITDFQKKLEAKGWKINIDDSKTVEIGRRCFAGTFFEEKANMVVNYDPHSKVVYECLPYIKCKNEHMMDLVVSIGEGIEKKYKDNIISTNSNSKNEIAIVIGDHDAIFGGIGLKVIVGEYNSVIFISYTDLKNLNNYNQNKEKKRNDDL